MAAPGEQIQKHIDQLTDLEIEPEIITCEQSALSAYLNAVSEQDPFTTSQILICI